ncbi:glutaredoxin 3 [Bordetella pertussis I036]|nr:glutaredoxin 3 [Bordetella pertussis CHLA-11]ETG98580.1 glutaredoxin 3 [Bordetella pertussis 2250905]ETH03813.1 glutaredoxin 3 [Bordetella pertussis 2356847]ETH09568.1 glutaredoxin 3 [Bordetella pertussis 2371640]ETH15930.1 glutaredoxin 3 [Bordetella pertussis STO1-SEAT-0007]ETH23091.1 glutaredoxin 3 [Bordetella pertussis CHLA-15]ETH27373.1 glutaredoxin 3 [Bordetella pertussis CHLA-20]ETH31308.1 glutaredoxin 3 [Bordetella pertussis CHLA-26]ETH35410.1 glutaredoxin 3 [Bordetella pertussis 
MPAIPSPPGATMQKVVMYSKDYCPYCARAQALLKQRGVADLEIIRIDQDPSQRDIMIERTGRRTVPQIFIGETHVGGSDDLQALDRSGGLLPLLNGG